MDTQCEKTFSLQSIFNQVLKPLDVKTKFYNAEVSGGGSLSRVVSVACALHPMFNIHNIERRQPQPESTWSSTKMVEIGCFPSHRLPSF